MSEASALGNFFLFQNLLKRCNGRKVLFDNKTLDPEKQKYQREELINLIKLVWRANLGDK